VRNLLAVPSRLEAKLRGIEDDLKVNVEGDEEEEIDEEGKDNWKDMEDVEKVNDCNKCLGGGLSSCCSSQVDSLRTILSICKAYIHLYCLYICGLINKSTSP